MDEGERLFRETMNEWQDSIIEFKYKLGYELTHKEKHGVKSWIYRNAGNLFHRRDWYEKGMENREMLFGFPMVYVDDVTENNLDPSASPR
jgi:hypothetical protein